MISMPTAATIERVLQEFYCNDCDGYIHLHIAAGVNKNVVICCPNPKCDRKHPRKIVNGKIKDNSRSDGPNTEEVMPMPSSYSKTPILGAKKHDREGKVSTMDDYQKWQAQQLLNESKGQAGWFDKFKTTIVNKVKK